MAVGIIVITSLWTELPSSSPTNAAYLASLYSRAALVLPQRTDPGLRLFQVLPQGFAGEKPGGMEPGGSSRKAWDRWLSFLLDSRFSTRNDLVATQFHLLL